MGIRIKQMRYEPLPVGEYVAVIGEIKDEEGQYGPQLRFRFDLRAPQGRSLVGWCSQTFSPRSKLYAWVRAAYGGRAIPPDWDFDSDALLGRTVRLVVITQVGEGGEEYNKISDVRPAWPWDVQAAPAEEPEPALPPLEEGDALPF